MKLSHEFIEFINKNPNLVTKKISKTSPNLFVVKYKKIVFYNALWNDYLRHSRGLVIDHEHNIISYGFDKIFNRGENGTVINRDHMVRAVRKINGFFAAASWYNDDILISTTGSLDSDFVQMAKDNLPLHKMRDFLYHNHNITFMFEICDPKDPHVITEEFGAYLIGARCKQLNSPLMNEDFLDGIADSWDVKRPEHKVIRFSDLVEETKSCKHEGWLVYDLESEVVLKMKSPYYLVSKFLARTKKMDEIFTTNYKQKFDEDFHSLIEYIQANYTKEQFLETTEQGRLEIVQNFLDT